MTRASRLLTLLQLLRERRTPVTAATLAESLAVSERTIYRDLAALAAQGAPVEGAAGLGYMLRSGYFLPPLMLDKAEADAVLLGLRFVRRRGDDALARAAQAAIAKLLAVMPAPLAEATGHNGLVVAPSGSRHPALLGGVRSALQDERKLRIRYRNAVGVASERTVWPVALGFFDDVEVLAAWCEDREAFRHFRIDRMLSLDVLAACPPEPRRALYDRWTATERGVEQ